MNILLEEKAVMFSNTELSNDFPNEKYWQQNI